MTNDEATTTYKDSFINSKSYDGSPKLDGWNTEKLTDWIGDPNPCLKEYDENWRLPSLAEAKRLITLMDTIRHDVSPSNIALKLWTEERGGGEFVTYIPFPSWLHPTKGENIEVHQRPIKNGGWGRMWTCERNTADPLILDQAWGWGFDIDNDAVIKRPVSMVTSFGLSIRCIKTIE